MPKPHCFHLPPSAEAEFFVCPYRSRFPLFSFHRNLNPTVYAQQRNGLSFLWRNNILLSSSNQYLAKRLYCLQSISLSVFHSDFVPTVLSVFSLSLFPRSLSDFLKLLSALRSLCFEGSLLQTQFLYASVFGWPNCLLSFGKSSFSFRFHNADNSWWFY